MSAACLPPSSAGALRSIAPIGGDLLERGHREDAGIMASFAAAGQPTVAAAPSHHHGNRPVRNPSRHLSQISNERHVAPELREFDYGIGQSCSAHADTNSSLSVATGKSETPPCSDRRPAARTDVPSVDVARCFLRLTNLPNFGPAASLATLVLNRQRRPSKVRKAMEWLRPSSARSNATTLASARGPMLNP